MTVASEMLEAFRAILASPFKELSVWWYLAPILILWFVLEVYFGKYKKEKLGWNTSLGNGITLTWINIEAMRFLFSIKPEPFWLRFIVLIIVGLYGVLIIYVAFTHKFKAGVTYSLAAPTPVYFLAAVVTLWGHGNLILTWWVLFDLILMYIFALLFFAILRKLLPGAEEGEVGAEEDKLTDLGDLGKEEKGKEPELDLKDKGLKDLKL